MAKILFITTGFTGILNSSFELIQRLETEGHQITYATLKDTRSSVEQQGISYLSLPKWHKELVPQSLTKGGKNSFVKLFYNYLMVSKRRRAGIEQLGQEIFKDILKKQQPDLVLIDIECHEYIFTTYVQGYPLLLVSQWFNGQYAPGLPMLSSQIMPTEGEQQIASYWRNYRRKSMVDNFKRYVRTAGTDRRSLMLQYARRIGFPISLLRFYNWPPPFTYTQIPILHFTDEHLELPHAIPPNHHYLGPMVFQSRQNDHPDLSSIEKKLSDIFNELQANGSKLIYCSVSTMAGGNGDFLQKVIDACATEPNWILILALGGHPDQLVKQVFPENIFVFSWLPQLDVLQQADCSLNHAGINTINECIACEVPMVIYSGGKHDQDGCAVRIAYHQLGVMGQRESATPERIHQDISEVLNNPTYRENVEAANRRSQSLNVRARLPELISAVILDKSVSS